MPYRICKTLEIENGHMLTLHPDKCRFPHGHSRRIEIILEATDLDDHGMVCDFKIIKEAVGEFLDSFDHSLCVNTKDPMFAVLQQAYGERIIAFDNTEPTTEVLAKTFFDECKLRLAEYANQEGLRYTLRKSVRLAKIRVWETSSSWAEYEEP